MARRRETLGSTARVIRRALHDFRRDLALTWSYGGWREIREAFLQRAVYRLYRRRTALLFEEDVTRVSQARLPAGVEVRVLGDRDWTSITGALTTRVLKRFRRNLTPWNTCLVAWRGERPVGYTWFSEPGATVEELPLRLPPDAAYGWDLWVDPRERRRGVGSALVRARLAYARERGFVRAWRIVIDSNLPALRTLERGGGRGRPGPREGRLCDAAGADARAVRAQRDEAVRRLRARARSAARRPRLAPADEWEAQRPSRKAARCTAPCPADTGTQPDRSSVCGVRRDRRRPNRRSGGAHGLPADRRLSSDSGGEAPVAG